MLSFNTTSSRVIAVVIVVASFVWSICMSVEVQALF